MDAIKAWAVTLCFAALAAGIAGVIAPSGNMEKIYKFAVSLFFLCCMLVPLFSIKKVDLKLNLSSTASVGQKSTDMQKALQQQTLQQAQINLEDIIRQRCIKDGVTPIGVDVQLSKNDAGSYDLSKVVIMLDNKDKDKETGLSSDLKQGFDIDVTFQEGVKK